MNQYYNANDYFQTFMNWTVHTVKINVEIECIFKKNPTLYYFPKWNLDGFFMDFNYSKTFSLPDVRTDDYVKKVILLWNM